MRVVAVLLCAAATAAHEHASARLTHAFPSSLNTPELRGPPARARRLAAPDARGAFASEHSAYSFTGPTARGFIDFSYDAVVRNTTVRLGDYAALLEASDATCQVLPGAPGRFTWRLSIPAAAAAAHPDEAAHLALRLVQRNVIVFDLFALAKHDSYAEDTKCADLISPSQPYALINLAKRSVAPASGDQTYEVRVETAQVNDLFLAVKHSFDWDPCVPYSHCLFGLFCAHH